ncbi:MAG: ABC transporter substrate-binding protein, partial [Bacteroidia bacterium]|nr:ABC transporter substrate-binding protein [Bacteroidia bacterium]
MNNGCKNVDKVSEGLIFRYNEDAVVSSLDPAYVKSQAEIWVASQIFNGLIELDSHLKPVPSLAKSWEITQNGTVYKFNLRRDVW